MAFYVFQRFSCNEDDRTRTRQETRRSRDECSKRVYFFCCCLGNFSMDASANMNIIMEGETFREIIQ